MKAGSELIKISASGDDRNLAQNGNDRHYWYSVRDIMTLLINARKEELSYINYKITPISGEEYSSLRPNDQRLLIADPYHQNNFAQYLADDVDKIIGNEEPASHAWEEMPNQIIIPLLSGAHWRAIRIEINYGRKSVSILWDDPYGEGHFPKELKDKLRESIIINVSKLISKEISTEFTLSTESITEVDKIIDQQGFGSNAWDCGPIIISNIVDYIKYSSVKNDHFNKYSITVFSDANHEQQIIDSRNLHIEQYTEVSGEPRFNGRLQLLREEEARVAEDFAHKLESFAHPYQQQVAQLSPSKVNMLFTLIESKRQPREQTEEYSELEIREALDYIDQHVVPISLDQHYDDEDFDINAINDLLKQKKSEFNKLSFAIGTDDFSTITESGSSFVDKTLLIREIIETRDAVSIITRPRRWGKTTNLDMLAKFFAIEVDESGASVEANSYRELFQNLRIGREYSSLVAQHQGQYPVIFFTFKNVKSNKYKEIEDNLIYELQKLYRNYRYLVSSHRLDETQKDTFKKYLTGEIKLKEIVSSLEFLSSLLKEHHGKKVYLFIDEYDSLLNATYNTEEYEDTLKMMRSMLGSALKGNNNLKKSLVTGITKIAKAGLFSDVNNVREYSILQSRYAEYFGFTEDEVQDLLQQAKITDRRVSMGVKEYYNGYNIGGYTIYNPWSIVSFLTDLELSSYWVNTEGSITGDRRLSTGLLMTSQMQAQVRELISNCYSNNQKLVEITISPEVVLHQLKDNPLAAWTVLAYGGYLSLSHIRKASGSSFICKAKIPNREVLEIYEDSISFWFRDELRVGLTDLEVLNIENVEKFEDVVRKLLLQKSEIIGEANESLFHSFIDGLYLLKGNTHRLSSEKKAGSGRIDSIYYPIKGKSEKIIIHEYKILGRTDTAQIDAKIQEALWQVYENYYFKESVSKYKEFNYQHYKQIEIRGIVAFIDESNNNLGMRSFSVLHTMEEIITMLPFFESLKRDDLIKIKAHYSISGFVQEYKKIGSLQEVLHKLEPSAEASDLDQANDNSVLAKRPRGEQEGGLLEIGQRVSKKLKVVGSKTSRKTEKYITSRKKARTEEQSSATISSYQDKHLTRYEKHLIAQRSPISLQYQPKIDLVQGVQFQQSVTLFSEHNHNLHAGYISSLIDMINNNLIADTIICLERKQGGNNLGISDVVALVNHLEQGHVLPTELKQLPIYYDALLYNAAKAKGVQVIGIEGKGLAHSKESPYYHQAREEYMAEQLLAIARSGKNAIFLVGSAHINNLIKLLSAQGFRADDSGSSLRQNLITLKPARAVFSKAFILPEIDAGLVRIANHEDIAETALQPNAENLVHEVAQSYFFLSYIYGFIKNIDLNWQIQKFLHSEDESRFESLKAKYGVTAPFDVFKGSDSDFRRSVLLKLHPDKNPGISEASDDFAFVTNLREELSKPFDVQSFINKKIQTIQPFIYRANIGFKITDAAVDITRLAYLPTIDNAKRVLIDSTYIYSAYSGANSISTIINGIDVAYKTYHGEYTQAFTQSLTTAGYMFVPMAISFVAVPYLGFLYGAAITIYTGYSAINNAYSFYNEINNQKHFTLSSNIAYQNIAEILSTTYLQKFYDFAAKAKKYEKLACKIKLEEKGEFGQKLYEYIYSRVLDEKYDTQNNSKAKHIKVIEYDHCMEAIELRQEESDHYYCYSEGQETLDHIVIIGGTHIEKIDNL